MDKVLIDSTVGGTGAVPYLSLNELTRRERPAAATETPQ